MRTLHMLMLSIAVSAMALSTAPAMADTPLPDGPHVVANGSGKVVAAPDMAEISVSVNVIDPASTRAKARVDDAVNRFLA